MLEIAPRSGEDEVFQGGVELEAHAHCGLEHHWGIVEMPGLQMMEKERGRDHVLFGEGLGEASLLAEESVHVQLEHQIPALAASETLVRVGEQGLGGSLQRLQLVANLEESRIEGKDPSGKVMCKVNGQRDVIEIKIDPSAVDPDDVEMLEDLVLFAVRDAMNKAEEFSTEKMGSLTQGLPQIPGLQFPPVK